MDIRELVRLLAEELQKAAPSREHPEKERIDVPLHEAVRFLRSRAEDVFAAMDKRVQLKDGRLGYRVRAEVEFALTLGSNFHDQHAPRELIRMKTAEAQVVIQDPVFTLDGGLRTDLEILSFTLEGESERLFDKKIPIRMHCGRFADKLQRPTLGRVEVPPGVRFGQVPVRVTHDVYVSVETPLGVLHNEQPALMVGYMTRFPPIGSVYEQVGQVPLLDEVGRVQAVKATQRSMLLQNLDG